MGKRAKKIKAALASGTRNIGEYMQGSLPRVAPKMADPHVETSSEEEETSMDALDEIPQAGGLYMESSDEENNTPATKGDIKSLLRDIRKMFQADLAILREDMLSLTGHLKAAEETSAHIKAEQTTLAAEQKRLTASQATMTLKLTEYEDRSRSKNIKIRGIPTTIDKTELPQYVGRLLQQILPHKQAKNILVDNIYRIRRQGRQPQQASSDIIIQLVTHLDKTAIMAAVRDLPFLAFERHNLTFYNDLSKPTMQWRQTMRPITSVLRRKKIPYRWGTPRSLQITAEGITHTIHSPEEGQLFLTQQGITTQRESRRGSPRRPQWDVDNIAPFESRRDPHLPEASLGD
ncbi:Hypothetical predicted protein [Pelobates cultripes]|uniref:Uncharacterized protein n=1 Tax=Pelobates cultripes TaxID=61616 RepID=A0AAD1T5C6_PELCU|nr:Hypothetical predicted protein [Pelobates cultripes]